MTSFLRALVALVVVLGLTSILRADGLIIVHDGPEVPHHFRFAPLEVTYHRVTVQINDLVAVTTIDQEFYNPSPRRLEGTYIFPLPDGAHIDKFAMDVGGVMTEAELLDADKARQIYEDIVRRQKDPALLEYVGRGAFKARIFPIEPQSRKQVKIQYTQLLKSDGGMVEYVYPLNTEKFSAKPLNDVSVKVDLVCAEPIKNVYSPSHTVEVRRDGERHAVVGYEAKHVRPDTDFRLIFSRTEKPVGLDLLSYRSGEDGYFVLLASPGLNAPAKQVQRRDVCFVLDTSGSMAGPKMEQAKKAIQFCLANLNEGDRFEIVRFSTEAETMFGKLEPASKENIDKAMQYVAALKPMGGTAIQDALARALAAHPKDPARTFLVIFLTDGQPTIGETREDALVSLIEGQNTAHTRIFSFGIGTDINTALLDRIAQKTRAFSQYVMPEEDIELKVSSFYTKIREPVLTGVQVAFEGEVKVSQVYPTLLPDLYKGDQLIVFGRYSGKGHAAVRIRGTVNGEAREFVSEAAFTESDTKHAFIPRLWATRRVGWLLDEIRLNGESPELKDEIVALARAHGIVTPYTAYLILEDEARRGVPMAQRSLSQMESDGALKAMVRDQYGSALPNAPRSGRNAVENAEALMDLKGGWNEEQSVRQSPIRPAPSDAAGEGYRNPQRDYTQQARVVKGRAFYQNGSVWVDSLAQQQQQLRRREIAFNSTEYFDLMRQHPEIIPWLSLGSEIDLVVGDTLYVVR